MSDVVEKANVRNFRFSVNTPDYPPELYLHNPPGLYTLFGSVASKYWQLNAGGDDIEEMTTGEKATVDDNEAAAQVAAEVQSAKDLHDTTSGESRALRVVVKLLVDELNDLRGWITQFKVDVEAAANLAQLKSSVAASGNLPDRTYAQARTAITTKIDGE